MLKKKPNKKSKYKEDDISLLLPSFQVKVKRLLQNMKDRGFNPILFDGYRTPEQAAKLAAKGTGIINSLHIHGAAADIIDGDKGWSNPEFFEALGEEAEKVGLTWGGRFTRKDLPHVQAVPVRKQNALRALATADEKEQFVSEFYA